MCEVLTKSGLSFMYKMIQEIISMPRLHSGYPHNFMVNSWVFKDDESETDAKTNRHRMCPLLVLSLLLAWRVHAQSPLLAHYTNKQKYTHTHITSPPRADLNFLKACAHWRGLPRGRGLAQSQDCVQSDVTHGIKCKFTH